MIRATYITGREELFISSSTNMPTLEEKACKIILRKMADQLIGWNIESYDLEYLSANELKYNIKINKILKIFSPSFAIDAIFNTMRFFHKGHIKVYHNDNIIVIEYKLHNIIWLVISVVMLLMFILLLLLSLFSVAPEEFPSVQDIFLPFIYITVAAPLFVYLFTYIIFFLLPTILFRYRLNVITKLVEEIPGIELGWPPAGRPPASREESSN